MQTATRILVVDPHPVFRRGVAGLFAGQLELAVCGEATDAQTALALAGELRPDLVTVEIAPPRGDGLDLVRRLRGHAVLALSGRHERFYARPARLAGAHGFVRKDADPAELLSAIRRIRAGGTYFPSPREEEGKRLSSRELAVLELVGRGLVTREVADSLAISAKTVETYREHLKRKLGLSGAAALRWYAVAWSLGVMDRIQSS